MDRALQLAERGRGRTSPNPLVGAVVVSSEGVVIGQGYHHRVGEAHAETIALDEAGDRARGATLYCTLEPCCHLGRTGPCVERIVAAGISRVVAAVEDPNPLVNGTGKTTTVGKLAKLLKAQGQTPLICAADTFRAAAVEQLEIWAKRAGVDILRAREGSDPAAVVFDAISSGKSKGRDPILVDTAGRLHTRVNLMQELEKIKRIAAREVTGAPQEVLLVLDATVGQNGVIQAREFMNAAGVNGIVLTKLDGTAKGGVAVAIANDLKLPIRYAGVGEAIDDLVPFSAEDYVNGLFEEKL